MYEFPDMAGPTSFHSPPLGRAMICAFAMPRSSFAQPPTSTEVTLITSPWEGMIKSPVGGNAPKLPDVY